MLSMPTRADSKIHLRIIHLLKTDRKKKLRLTCPRVHTQWTLDRNSSGYEDKAAMGAPCRTKEWSKENPKRSDQTTRSAVTTQTSLTMVAQQTETITPSCRTRTIRKDRTHQPGELLLIHDNSTNSSLCQ